LFEDPLWRDEPPNPDYRPGLDDPFDSLDHIYTENVPPLHDIIQGMRVVIDTYSTTRYCCEVIAIYPILNKIPSRTNTRILICETYAGYEELLRYYGCDPNGKDKVTIKKKKQLNFIKRPTSHYSKRRMISCV